jgi:GNAT superfamily N-acetyltransferase
MNYRIIEITDNRKKEEYTNIILQKILEWLGLKENMQEYINSANEYLYWAAFDNDNCIGLFSGKILYSKEKDITGDIYVYGVDPKYHGKGIGTLLYKKIEKYFLKNGCKNMLVYINIGNDHNEKNNRTRDFYLKKGFIELLTVIRIPENRPYLVMMK